MIMMQSRSLQFEEVNQLVKVKINITPSKDHILKVTPTAEIWRKTLPGYINRPELQPRVGVLPERIHQEQGEQLFLQQTQSSRVPVLQTESSHIPQSYPLTSSCKAFLTKCLSLCTFMMLFFIV